MVIIAVVSQKGGAGKTTLSLNLATMAQHKGRTALVIDTDPQATAAQWGAWRNDSAPQVIDSAPVRLEAKIKQAKDRGANFIVIDTPPYADSAASMAIKDADIVLVPCRPSAFDMASIKTTVSLVKMYHKLAFAIFTAGVANAPRMYDEASQVVQSYGLPVSPYYVADRAIFRHAAGLGKTAWELAPQSKAAQEIQAIYKWLIQTVEEKEERV